MGETLTVLFYYFLSKSLHGNVLHSIFVLSITTKAITMKKWNYQIVSIQRWNNDNEVVLSYHKTLQSAEREKRANERKNESYLKRYPKEKGNDYRIEQI